MVYECIVVVYQCMLALMCVRFYCTKVRPHPLGVCVRGVMLDFFPLGREWEIFLHHASMCTIIIVHPCFKRVLEIHWEALYLSVSSSVV